MGGGPDTDTAREPCEHNEHDPQHSGQQEGNTERQVPMGTEEADVHALAVFQDETSSSTKTTAKSAQATHSELIRLRFAACRTGGCGAAVWDGGSCPVSPSWDVAVMATHALSFLHQY